MRKQAFNPQLDPHVIDKNTWWYEERKGLCVVRQIYDVESTLLQADIFYLPWRKLDAAVQRRRDRLRKT